MFKCWFYRIIINNWGLKLLASNIKILSEMSSQVPELNPFLKINFWLRFKLLSEKLNAGNSLIKCLS